VDRILQALLTQQGRQGAGSSAGPGPSNAGASHAEASQQTLAPPAPSASASSDHGDPFDDYMFDPTMVDVEMNGPQMLTQQQQQQALANANRDEWLLKSGWTPNLLGPPVPPP
jgi:hypothetical protein